MIKEHDVKYVDFRFTDPRGKWQHLAHHIRTINEDFLNEGVMFDGSSIAGWKAINESDMMGQVLPLAARIGEAEIDVFDVVLLDQIHDFLGIRHCDFPFQV